MDMSCPDNVALFPRLCAAYLSARRILCRRSYYKRSTGTQSQRLEFDDRFGSMSVSVRVIYFDIDGFGLYFNARNEFCNLYTSVTLLSSLKQ